MAVEGACTSSEPAVLGVDCRFRVMEKANGYGRGPYGPAIAAEYGDQNRSIYE